MLDPRTVPCSFSALEVSADPGAQEQAWGSARWHPKAFPRASKEQDPMLRRTALFGLAALAAIACQSQNGPEKSGPVVAKGSGFTITADEFKARLDEQSPFIRSRYSTLERKKEFLDNMVRFEVLAREAERQGLAKDPEVQNTLKKIMVQKLVQKNFQDQAGATQIPDEELQKYYDERRADYHRPRRVRAALVVFNAPKESSERAKKLAAARKALAAFKAEEKKTPLAFTRIVNEYSEDPATKASSGDLNFKSEQELEAAYSKELAQAIFALKQGETSGVIETAKGIYIARVTAQQEEMNRSFEQVKPQIQARLSRERKTKEFDAWLKNLKDDAKITVDDKALEAIEIAVLPPGAPGMSGMPMGHPGVGGPMGVRPAPGPSTPPNPPAAPAAK
jgi:peptidyl-prolyl cis-trans isomerase C